MSVRRPHVAHVTVLPDFVDRIMLHDLRRLRAHEDITIICTDGPALARARAEGFRVLTVAAHRKMSPLRDLGTVTSLWRIFRRERFDLVHTYAPKAGLLGQMAARLAGVPRRIHGCRGLLYSPKTPPLQRRILRITDRVTAGLADLTLFLSSGDLRFATTEGLCRADCAHHIGSGVDLACYGRTDAVEAAGREWRESMGIGPDATLVLSVGRYVADKGYREIAEAAAAVRRQHPDARFVWVAPVFAGEDGVLPEDLASALGVADIVVRTGFVDDMVPVFAAADLLVHASYREGVPRAVMEAAAMEVPVLASDIPGCREVVTHGESALLFPPHDGNALAAALLQALGDMEAMRARAHRARAEIEERFDLDTHAGRVLAAHQALLAAPDGAAALRNLTRAAASPRPASV